MLTEVISASEVIRLLTALGIGAVLLAVVNGLFSKRKLSAEATKIITDAASGVVEIQKAEIARVVASNILLTAKVEAQQIQFEEMQRVLRAQGELLAVHTFWDQQVVSIARDHSIELPPAPPLHPTQPPGS